LIARRRGGGEVKVAKRFTATEKWLDPWFCNLSIVDRLFWIYLCDNCDHSGIWQVNLLLVKTYFPGYEPNPAIFGDRLKILTPEKWLLTKFVEFQYGKLNPTNRAHQSVIAKLQKEGAYKGHTSPFQGAKDKDKDKEDVKDVRDGVEGNRKKDWFAKIWLAYPKERRHGKSVAWKRFDKSVQTLEDAKGCARALEAYLKSDVVARGYVMRASKWFEEWEDHVNDDGRNSQSLHDTPNDRRPDISPPREREPATADNVLQRLADSKRI